MRWADLFGIDFKLFFRIKLPKITQDRLILMEILKTTVILSVFEKNSLFFSH